MTYEWLRKALSLMVPFWLFRFYMLKADPGTLAPVFNSDTLIEHLAK